MAEVERRSNPRRGHDMHVTRLIEQQGELIERQRRALRSAVIGYIILSLGIAAALSVIEHRDAVRARDAERVALRAQVAACDRVNLLRSQANGTSEISFATLYLSAQRERALADGARGATHARSARALAYLAGRTKHTPLTDCQLAVYHADTYKRPVPRPFDPRTDMLVKTIARQVGAGK